MPWWALILLAIGVCGGLPALAFAALFGLEMWRERRLERWRERDVEKRAERLATRMTQDGFTPGYDGPPHAVSAPPRPHRGFRT
jgi:hypothetical protein